MIETKKPRKELRRMSDKQRAKLAAEGHASPRSTLRSSPSPSKPRGTKQGMMRRQSKPLPKVNPERQAKRRKSYAQKLAAYKRSETYKAVEARAAGRCEGVSILDAGGEYWEYACEATRAAGNRLTHHHKTYARFGGAELPEDIVVLCDHHNAEAESKHPTRNRDYRRKATA